MKIEILDIAMSDIRSGQRFYEVQQEGLGAYFLDSLFSDIDALLLYAGIHPQFLGYYRVLSKRFPYAIYYWISEQAIQVWRVLDCRQKPTRTVKKLKGR